MPLNDAPDWRAEGRRKSQDELRRRTIEHMRNKTTDLAAGPMKIDPAIYKDPARFELEKRALFRNSPILAGLTLDIPEPGTAC